MAVRLRPFPEIIPEVTEFWYAPSALPIAITCCPVDVVLESPNLAGERLSTFLILMIAKSLRGSVPINSTSS